MKVPKMKPVTPKMIITMSLYSFQRFLPSWSGQHVMISMSGGKISASAELLNAPTNEIIPLKFGIRAAAKTETDKTYH